MIIMIFFFCVNVFKDDIYSEGTILEKMEKLRTIKKESPEYNRLYEDIISVGEFDIHKM